MGASISWLRAPNRHRYILDDKRRKIIKEFWPKIAKKYSSLFVLSWLSAAEASPAIKSIFGIVQQDDPLENPKFMRTIREAQKFFDLIVNEYDLKVEKCCRACFALGARHFSYDANGFKPFYWDIFSACLLNSLDEELERNNETNSVEVQMAWRTLVHKVVELMRIGYNQQAQTQCPEKLWAEEERDLSDQAQQVVDF